MNINEKRSSFFDLPERVVALVLWLIVAGLIWFFNSTLFGFVFLLVALIIEKKSDLVRTHAGQAMIFYLVTFAIQVVFTLISVILTLIIFTANAVTYNFNFFAGITGNLLSQMGAVSPIFGLLSLGYIVIKVILVIFCLYNAYLAYQSRSADYPILTPLGKTVAEKIK